MRLISLQSGSNGNCIFVEAGGVRLLFDAGLSGVQAERRLAQAGVDIRTVDGLLISHDHDDHVRAAGILQRKYGLGIHATAPTWAAAQRRMNLGAVPRVLPFTAGETLRFGAVTVETIPTPHDAVDGVGFVVEADGKRLGILTDLGHVYPGLAEVLATLDGVLLESNYDPELLEHGPYPAFLKARIRGSAGHLSNEEAATLIGTAGKRLAFACLGHLSQTNNTPALAQATCRKVLGERLPVYVASRYQASQPFEL